MKANDLRIGNWVKDLTYSKEDEQIVQVESIMDFFDQYEVKRINDVMEEFIEPIPLTPEWLERLGGKLTGNVMQTYLFDEFLIVESRGDDESFDCWIKDGHHTSLYLTNFSFVHELQNLYFSLRKEELTARRDERK